MVDKPTSTTLDDKLKEADAAITSSSTYKPSKAERNPNRLGKSYLQGNVLVSAAQSDAAMSAFSLVKDQVVNFADNSKILMSALDEVAKVHPVIQVAVSLFKAALTLELTRRQNDEKVLALNATMCDMMSILTLLKPVASSDRTPGDSLTIEDRLNQRIGGVVESIKACAKVCDSYHKRNLAVKIFTSVKWQAKFTEVAEQFVSHKSALQLDLQMYTSIGVASTNSSLAVMSQNIDKVMEMVFELMRSPEERELANFISSKPGGTKGVLQNENLLKQVLARERSPKDSLVGVGAGRVDAALTVASLQREVEKDVETVLSENTFFEQKFEAMRMQLEEVKVTIKHETDRVINAVLSGPHERIIDRDLYHIWKEMGWKGSVKATHLVMAIRDHFAEESQAALAVIRDLTEGSDPQSAAVTVSEIGEVARRATYSEDAWALQYITVSRVQPLIEAIDSDVSSFVTVSEVNAFTSARPAGWSLPRWIAYWMYGYEMTLRWYSRRIRDTFAAIHFASRNILPANFTYVGTFISSAQICFAESLLSGLHPDDARSAGDDWETTFAKFKDYVVGREKRLAEKLRRIKYYIDESNTLTGLIVGRERPETYALPLVYLLLRRSLSIIRQGASVVLHQYELATIRASLDVLWDAIDDRVITLRAMFKFQHLATSEQISNFCFGLYAHALEEDATTPYWKQEPVLNPEEDSPTETLSASDNTQGSSEVMTGLESDEPPLFFGPQVEELETAFTDRANSQDLDESERAESSLVGHWSGHYSYEGGSGDDGLVNFIISKHTADGNVEGDGKDAWGPFTIRGNLSNTRFAFLKTYAMLQGGAQVVWYYEGTVQDGLDAMEGCWGLPESVLQVQRLGKRILEEDDLPLPGSEAGRPIRFGTFTLQRRPVEYYLVCPPPEEFERNRNRALWTLAINFAMHTVRSRQLRWDTLSARRKLRERYIELQTKQRAVYLEITPQEERERDALLKDIHPDDLHGWNAVSMFRMRREIVHRYVITLPRRPIGTDVQNM
ncbi:hypothetical protein OH77DRAFT_1539828 [Trametes cingulata]|nr:hypothetical protein OH77DRAFT_1539828 [Trametes cingulata]